MLYLRTRKCWHEPAKESSHSSLQNEDIYEYPLAVQEQWGAERLNGFLTQNKSLEELAIGPRILSTSPWSHYMKTVFLGILLSTDIIPPNGSDLTSVTRATKSNSGMLSPIPILFITSHFWTCIAQQHNTRSKATTPSQLTLGRKVSPKVTSSHDHPKATWLRKLTELWDHGLGLRGSVRKTAIILDLLPVLLKAEFGPA